LDRGIEIDQIQAQYPFSIQTGWTDITPGNAIPLAGYLNRHDNFDSILTPLEANIVIVGNKDQRVILVSLDVLFAGQAVKAAVLSNLQGRVKGSELFIWATHNHFAPSIDPDKPLLGRCDDKYLQYVSERVSKLIEDLLREEPKKGQLSYGHSENDDLSINRRRRTVYFEKKGSMVIPHWGTTLLPNKRKYRDGRISTISIDDDQGRPLALIWSFACHPVSSPGNNDVRADYPGEVRRLARAHVQREIPVVFFQGLSGDLKPPSLQRFPKDGGYRKTITYIMTRAINRRNFVQFDETGWAKYVASVWDATKNASEDSNRLILEPNLEVKTTEIGLKALGLLKDKNLTMCSIKIGALRIIAFSAEPVAEWNPIVKGIFPDETLITTGCFEDVSCYLPTEGMIIEKGYEVEGFIKSFSLSGNFKQGMGQEIISSLNELK
jgi:neutral ceramidase